jgi:hypothetical protein
MKKSTYALLALTGLMVVFASACGLPAAAPAQQPAAPAAPVENAPAQPADVAQPPAQGLAPACQAGTSCSAPAVSDTAALNTYCVLKVPYQNILLDPGTTFESLDPQGELQCADSGTQVDGKNVISCHGKELWTYELKLTNTACGGSSLQAGTAQCADGQGYDAANNCCAPISNGEGGSVTIKVNIGACPIK